MQYLLAPLEDTSDNALRELCSTYGADLTFTEMARIEGLARNNKATLHKTRILSDVPTQIQIVGSIEDHFVKFLASFKVPEQFKGFNLNLGCPSPQITGIGQGCAMMKRTAKVDRIVTMIKKAGYPVSLKMRLGLNEYERKKKVYLNLLNNTDADFYVVHARSGNEHYETPADFQVYPECVDTGKSIIANGDIASLEQIKDLKKIGVRGVMIGRAAVYNPAIFAALQGKTIPLKEELRKEYLDLTQKYKTPSKYVHNVLMRIGRKESMDKKKLQFFSHTQG